MIGHADITHAHQGSDVLPLPERRPHGSPIESDKSAVVWGTQYHPHNFRLDTNRTGTAPGFECITGILYGHERENAQTVYLSSSPRQRNSNGVSDNNNSNNGGSDHYICGRRCKLPLSIPKTVAGKAFPAANTDATIWTQTQTERIHQNPKNTFPSRMKELSDDPRDSHQLSGKRSLHRLKPLNTFIKKEVDYRSYCLLKTSARHDDQVAKKIGRCQKHLYIQLKGRPFSASEPIATTGSLQRFKTACDHYRVTVGAALWCF